MKIDPVIEIPSYGLKTNPDAEHGMFVIAAAAGQTLGVAPGATVVPVRMDGLLTDEQPIEVALHALLLVANDVKAKKMEVKAVVNMSWGTRIENVASIRPWKDVLCKYKRPLRLIPFRVSLDPGT